MVKSGIVLNHVVSQKSVEVDKVKVDLISNLPPPKTFSGCAIFIKPCRDLLLLH